jgi:hypothetical protein
VSSALVASAAVSLVATPTELLKCRLQAQGDPKAAAARLAAAGIDPKTVGKGGRRGREGGARTPARLGA